MLTTALFVTCPVGLCFTSPTYFSSKLNSSFVRRQQELNRKFTYTMPLLDKIFQKGESIKYNFI